MTNIGINQGPMGKMYDLIDLIGSLGREVYYMLDDCETSGDVGEETHIITDDGLTKVSAILDKIDTLPFEVENVILGTGAMLQEALKRTFVDALAARDATIARLQAEIDRQVEASKTAIARLQAELVTKDDAWIADQTANAAEIIRLGDNLDRLQARLDAGPTVEAVKAWAECGLECSECREGIAETIDRMEAANGK